VIAAGRVIDIEVQADPESCQVTVAQLARLGEACRQAAVLIGRQAQVGEDDFGGLSGGVYRQSSAELAATGDRLAVDCARLADGLADYARDIGEVRRLMREALAAATPHLTATESNIWSPVRPPDGCDARLSEAWAAWHAAVDWWRRARALEDAAEQQWLHVLGRGPAPDEPVRYGDDEEPPHHPERHRDREPRPAIDDDEPPVPVEDTIDDHVHEPVRQPHAEPVPKDRDRPSFDPATTMASAPAPRTAS
jgi:hypothetical protein